VEQRKGIGYVADPAASFWYANANMYHDLIEKAFA
jgi:hypothetical protein